MFEKEAEEYATRECCMTCNNINHFCKEKCECWTFAKKGAEFGYNKAFVEADKNLKAIVTDFNKEKCELLGIIQGKDKVIQELKKELNKVNEWHKVADGDLPKNNTAVLVILKNKRMKISIFMENKFTIWNNDYDAYTKLYDVIAWCEIPTFKE